MKDYLKNKIIELLEAIASDCDYREDIDEIINLIKKI